MLGVELSWEEFGVERELKGFDRDESMLSINETPLFLNKKFGQLRI